MNDIKNKNYKDRIDCITLKNVIVKPRIKKIYYE